MREEPCKTYGHLFPADQHIADAVGAVLSDWNIPECTELEGDIFRISFEGVFFPLDDVLDALRPLLCAESSGKIDLIDMEAWTLTRAAFSGTEIRGAQPCAGLFRPLTCPFSSAAFAYTFVGARILLLRHHPAAGRTGCPSTAAPLSPNTYSSILPP